MVFARRTARAAGVESVVAQRLSNPVRETFVRANVAGWVPIEHATEIFDHVAQLVYPTAETPLRELGRALARDNLGGAYKHFVRIMSVPFLMKQAAFVWRAYHNAGRPTVATLDRNRIELRVFDYADLPDRFRECMCGWIEQAVSMTGGKNPRVTNLEGGDVYAWHITWT